MGTARGGRLHKFDQKYRCGTLQPGGVDGYNEGKRTLAYYPKIDDKYCFFDAMASLKSMLESERVGDVFETLLV